MLFSQRTGLSPKKEIIQTDSMDLDLVNRLWNNVYEYLDCFFNGYDNYTKTYFRFIPIEIWGNFYKYTIDKIPGKTAVMFTEIKNAYFNSAWYRIYDFIEFIANIKFEAKNIHYDDRDLVQNQFVRASQNFIEKCNEALKSELSGYRFISNKIVPVSDIYEVEAIENTLTEANNQQSLTGVKTHLETAIKLFSDRKNPEYRNSIKESISAIESICQVITGNKKATLGDALKKISENVNIHPALVKSFSNLYGYTSDSDGIRHAMTEESSIDFEDAKYMLVTCSSFIHYLVVKADKAGVPIN